jgi:hypothetical protein
MPVAAVVDDSLLISDFLTVSCEPNLIGEKSAARASAGPKK